MFKYLNKIIVTISVMVSLSISGVANANSKWYNYDTNSQLV